MKCKQTGNRGSTEPKVGSLEKSYKVDKSLTKLVKKQGAGNNIRNEDDTPIYYINVKEIVRGHRWFYANV